MAVKNKIFIPTLISSVTYQPVRTLPHIYFYNGLKDCEPYYIQHYPTGSTSFVETSVQEKFPYLDYYDGLEPTTGSNSLLFFNETPPYGVTPTGSLYTQYWDKYVSLLYNPRTRLIKASAIIPLADYFEMELNDIVQWRGNYYHLRAINDYNLKDGTCKLELLGPIIRDAGPTAVFDCTFNFSSSLAGEIPTTTTTIAPSTTTTLSPTTSTTTVPPTTSTTTLSSYTIEYLMVAGGAGGGSRHAGGGGAGGYLTGSAVVSGSTSYSVVIGAGGNGSIGLGKGSNGNNTTFYGLTAHGGGYGGGEGFANGGVGGSGGGALGANGAVGGASSGSQGFAGGNGINYAGGGGGGASQAGVNGVDVPSQDIAGNGGSGSAWLNGVFYAGGGGGGIMDYGTRAGAGGIGGGGAGGDGSNGSNGIEYTGGGGGGAGGISSTAFNGGYGGSGITIIRYSGSPRGTGGTITESGSYTYHTFTASGDFTVDGYIAPPTTTTTLSPTTTTTTTLSLIEFSNSGYGNTVNGACSDASINNRTLYSDCPSINVGCTIYTTSGGTPLTGYTFVFIDAAVWEINSSTGVITNYSSIQC